MGEVRVHLEHERRPFAQRHLEAGQVRLAQALLARPVQDPDARVLAREPVGELPGAVGRRVVHDQDGVVGRARRPARTRTARTSGSRFSRSL